MNYSKKIKLATAVSYIALGIGCFSVYGSIKYAPKKPESVLKVQKLEAELNAPIKSVKLNDFNSLANRVEQLNEELQTTKNSPVYKEQLKEYEDKKNKNDIFFPLAILGFGGVMLSALYKNLLKINKEDLERI
ncbi:MAG: hypothetical protein WC413_03850 [Candidatus Nanoarchaeia archaeon]